MVRNTWSLYRWQLIVLAIGLATSALATNYYVSPTGLDGNAGTSAGAAWQSVSKINNLDLNAGDQVFFEGGKTFTGPLTLGSADQGTSASRIIVSSYGTGRATIQAGTGANGITLSSCQYLTLKNINVTGPGYTDNNNGVGTGIKPSSCTFLTIDSVETTGFLRAGLEFNACNDLRLTHIYAHDNGYAGISANGGNNQRPYIGYCVVNSNHGGIAQISGNHSGNGIVLYGCNNGTIEYNETAYNGRDNKGGNGPVGNWCANSSDNLIFQFNVSHNNLSPSLDGGGFDADGGISNIIMQYNYAYENKNYGFQACSWGPAVTNVTMRYNISIYNTVQEISIWDPEYLTNIMIYNNVFINKDQSVISSYGTTDTKRFKYWNNIFGKTGNAGAFTSNLDNTTVFVGNCYWDYNGGSSSWSGGYNSFTDWVNGLGQEKVNGQVVGMYADPKLVDPFNYTKVTDPTQMIPNLGMFKLQTVSPCIDAGLNLNTFASVNVGTRDFYGTSIPQGTLFDIGASERVTGPESPSFSSTPVTAAAVGRLYTYTAIANGNPAPTYSASGLPSWLTFNATTGVLSGTPALTHVGTTGTITITANNSQGSVNQTFQIVVNQGSWVMVDDRDVAINYRNASWNQNSDGGFYQSTQSYSNVVNDSITFTFIGSGIRWYGFANDRNGIGNVYIDGVLAGTGDLYSATGDVMQKMVFEKTGLSNASHTLKIVVTGTKAAGSGNTWISVDALEYFTGSGSTTISVPKVTSNVREISSKSISVYSLDGSFIKLIESPMYNEDVMASSLVRGIYLVVIKTEKEIVTKRLLVTSARVKN